MQYTAPHYYKKFRCTAGNCPDTCCAGWQIQIDSKSLKKYRKIKGGLGSRLKNEIDWKEGCFRRYDGRCAFLNEKNLCDLYLEGGGEKAFCRTCRTYPRHVEEFEGLREVSLSLSCPVAAEIILGTKEPVHFLHAENPQLNEPCIKDYEDFDYFLFTKLMDTRSLIVTILQNRTHPLRLRAAAALALSHDLQERIDRNALFDVDGLLERYSSPRMWTWFENRLKKLRIDESPMKKSRDPMQTLDQLFSLFEQMEVLRKDWPSCLLSSRRTLAEYQYAFPGKDAGNMFPDVFDDISGEQLLVYFVFTYFCGAVYNRNAYGKMKFAITGLILIRELVRAQWCQNTNQIDHGQVIMAAVRYSREIEHSDYNKVTMEQLLNDEEIFGLENFFQLL